jgi:glycosyltransferase involved in cell wall biosynthesis
MDNPSFSIVIPTFERRDLVCDTVRTLSELTFEGTFEVIVVVDGSTDGTAAALVKLECPFPLSIIEQENSGLAAARNRGAAEASGDILLFLDDDMIAQADLLNQHARFYRAGAGADAVAGGIVEEAGAFAGFRTSATHDEEISSPFGVYGGHISVRRAAFDDVGGFDPNFTSCGDYGHEDSDLAYRLLHRFRIMRNPAAICHHRKCITAREYINRGRSSAAAELRLLKKHPGLRLELAEWAGASRLSRKMRLLSSIPVVPRIFASAVSFFADRALRSRPRLGPKLQYLCSAAYTLDYWSAVQRQRVAGLR